MVLIQAFEFHSSIVILGANVDLQLIFLAITPNISFICFSFYFTNIDDEDDLK